jgi:hypothetical protein
MHAVTPPNLLLAICTMLACGLAECDGAQTARVCHAAAAKVLVTPAGCSLADKLDRLDVEHHWLSGEQHVAWRTGEPTSPGPGNTPAPGETHCSAFAAAAADQLAVYLLRPPEHSHVLLADAQFDWLSGAVGRKAGWEQVEGPLDAQRLANAGKLVLAVVRNPNPKLPGHIAVVRPCEKRVVCIQRCGPEIMQAGMTNSASTDLAVGFEHHRGAWLPNGKGSVRFFSHSVNP